MQQTTSTMAVASLVLGIIALVLLFASGLFQYCIPLPLVLGILAWVMGKNALDQIEAGLGNPNDRGLAVAGYVMGIIATVLSGLGLCCLVGTIAGMLGFMVPILRQVPWGP